MGAWPAGGYRSTPPVAARTEKPTFAYLRAVVVPTAVYAASEDWGTGGDEIGALERRLSDLRFDWGGLGQTMWRNSAATAAGGSPGGRTTITFQLGACRVNR